MPEKITVPVTGGCPKCGNQNLTVPENYTDDTVITCPQCKHKARWVEFFPRESAD